MATSPAIEAQPGRFQAGLDIGTTTLDSFSGSRLGRAGASIALVEEERLRASDPLTQVDEDRQQDTGAVSPPPAAPAAPPAASPAVLTGPQPTGSLDNRDRYLWGENIRPNLKGNLWTAASAMSAYPLLMVPIHAAFAHNEAPWLDEIEDQFRRFVSAAKDPQSSSPVAASRLSRLYYYYLASRFLTVAQRKGAASRIPPGLAEVLRAQVTAYWQSDPAWQWDREPFQGGMRERLFWKLATPSTPKSYFRGLHEEDFLLMGIAADLRSYDRLVGAPDDPVLSDILAATQTALKQETRGTLVGGWLLQPGVWWQHHEYAYAGHQTKQPGLTPAPLIDVAYDSSHSACWPVILLSFYEALAMEPRGAYFDALRQGLETQFFSRVLVAPSADFPWYRLTNYMDGRNGLYRWGFSSLGPESGYGPYELSGSILYGLWSFLDTERTRQVYAEIAAAFPYPPEPVALYLGPAPSAPTINGRQHELLPRLASKIRYAH